MATEDISMTWQLQAAGWQVRYEPRALFAMQVPEQLHVWWRQRVRWARGMGQVLRRFGGHAGLLAAPAAGGDLVRGRGLGAVGARVRRDDARLARVPRQFGDETSLGANPLIAYWGMVIALVCIAQAVLGVWLDRRYDTRIWRSLLWLPLVPAVLLAAALRGGGARDDAGRDPAPERPGRPGTSRARNSLSSACNGATGVVMLRNEAPRGGVAVPARNVGRRRAEPGADARAVRRH